MRPNVNIIDYYDIDKSFSKNNFEDPIFSVISSLFEINLLESAIAKELNDQYDNAKYNHSVAISSLNQIETSSNLNNKTTQELYKRYLNKWFETNEIVERYRKMLQNASVFRSTFIDGISDIVSRKGYIIELIYKEINSCKTLHIDIFITSSTSLERIQNIQNRINDFVNEELLGIATPYPVTACDIIVRDK